MKKLWLIPAGIALVGLVVGVFYYTRNTAFPPAISPGGETVETVTPAPAFDLTTWVDEAGFSFQYPKDLAIDKHEEDLDNYAHVELTSPDHPGRIIVWVSDLPSRVTDTASWVKNTSAFAGAIVVDTMLGGLPAKKIRVSSPSAMLTVGTVTDNLLFSVEGVFADSDFWTRVHEAITGSFIFTPEESTGASNAGEGAESVDEEEVVQ